MKKLLSLSLAALLALSLCACGAAPAQPAASGAAAPEASAPAVSAPAASAPAAPEAAAPAGIKPAVNGTLTVSAADLAVVVNEVPVPAPYRLGELKAAGLEADESITVGAGQFFSLNLYLDENEDYLLIPYYYNAGSEDVSVAKAEAGEIAMTTYAGEPADQGVSIFGIAFGMTRSQVKTLLGEPSMQDGNYSEWHVDVPELDREGTLYMYFTEDADTGAVSQVDLSTVAK